MKHITSLTIRLVSVALILFIAKTGYATDKTVLLQTNFETGVSNSSVTKSLDCIFGKIDRTYSISTGPRIRNRELTRVGEIDGFFLSLPNREIDKYAISSQPLALERWNFFSLQSSSQPARPNNESIGSILGSNESRWLSDNKFTSVITFPNMPSLVRILDKNRVHYILADEFSFRDAARENGLSQERLTADFVRYAPLVMYFSRQFIKTNPGFLARFNNAIGTCLENITQSSQNEKDYLSELAISFADARNDNSSLANLLQSAPPVIQTIEKLNILDLQWKYATQKGVTIPLIEELLKNKLSHALKGIASGSKGKILEIFAFDDRGYILGLNQATSDYWQGDESAYQALFPQNKDIYISPIEFDLSTRTFEIQISLPIYKPNTNTKIGGITIGFDADIALSAQ